MDANHPHGKWSRLCGFPGRAAPDDAAWALLGLVAVAAAANGVWRALHGGSDFPGFHRAARSVWTASDLSLDDAVRRYLPAFRILLAPLGALALPWACALWQALNLAALAATPRALERLSGIPRREQLLAFAAVAPFLFDSFALGQSAPLLLWLVTEGLALARVGRASSGGALIAAAALVKIVPALFLAVPAVLRRAWRTALGAGSALVALAILSTAIVPLRDSAGASVVWWREVSHSQAPWDLVASGRALRHTNQGLGVVLARTLTDVSAARARGKVQLASIPSAWAWRIYGAILTALAAGWLAGAVRARRLESARAWLGMQALTAIAMLAASPIVWPHYFAWLLPALLFLHPRRRAVLACGAGAWLAIALPPARALGFHMFLSLGLFAAVLRELWRAEERTSADLDRLARG